MCRGLPPPQDGKRTWDTLGRDRWDGPHTPWCDLAPQAFEPKPNYPPRSTRRSPSPRLCGPYHPTHHANATSDCWSGGKGPRADPGQPSRWRRSAWPRSCAQMRRRSKVNGKGVSGQTTTGNSRAAARGDLGLARAANSTPRLASARNRAFSALSRTFSSAHSRRFSVACLRSS